MVFTQWYLCISTFENNVEEFFERLTRFTYNNPAKTVGLTLLFTFVCSLGFLNMKTLSSSGELWVPQHSSLQDDRHYKDDYYEKDAMSGILLLTSNNVITLDAFDELWEIYEDITAITVGDKDWYQLCDKNRNGDCMVSGPLQFWSLNRTTYNEQVNSTSDLQTQISVQFFPDGSYVNRGAIFGLMTVDENNTIVEAEAMTQFHKVVSEDESDKISWADSFLNIASEAVHTSCMLYYFTGKSIDDELMRAVGGDIILMTTTYLLMCAFTAYVMSKKFNMIESRFGLSVCGIGVVLLAIAAGYGFSSGCGIPFISLHQVLPFIVVGVGVDDMFIIVASYDATDRELSVEERMVAAMRSCGLSISYTTATDVVAFLIGSSSILPAIRAFCLYAAMTFFFNFVFQITLFCALLSMDGHRMNNRKYDLFWCASSNDQVMPTLSRPDNADIEKRESYVQLENANQPQEQTSDDVKQKDNTYDSFTRQYYKQNEDSFLKRFFGDIYAPFLTNNIVRTCTVVFFACLFASCVLGASQLTVGFDLVDLVPDDSYVRSYMNEARRVDLFFFENNIPVGIYFKDDVDYASEDVQQSMLDCEADFLNSKYNSRPVGSWIRDFNSWLPYSTYAFMTNDNGFLTNDTLFYEAVGSFVSYPDYSFYNDHIIFEYDNVTNITTDIISSRIMGYHVNLFKTGDGISAMKYTRSMADDIDVTPHAFAFTYNYIFAQTNDLILGEMIFNLGVALIAVGGITLFILVRPLAVVVVTAMLVVIDVDILGSMFFWSLEINTITVVQLVMAVGLVVDYISHVLHYYLKQPWSLSPNDRMITAMREIGPSVLFGCLTTFIGIVPLAFANSTIFRIFFRMFLSIITLGALHGLLLLPVIMPIIPFGDKSVEELCHEGEHEYHKAGTNTEGVSMENGDGTVPEKNMTSEKKSQLVVVEGVDDTAAL